MPDRESAHIPLIDLRCIELAQGDRKKANQLMREAQRRKKIITFRASKRQYESLLAQDARESFQKWEQRCAEIKAEAWRKGTPNNYTLPDPPSASPFYHTDRYFTAPRRPPST